jgi:hypothetical protein
MNIYLSKKQRKVMNILLDTAEELINQSNLPDKENLEDFFETVMELKSKINRTKKLAKNGVVFEPVEIPCAFSDDTLILRAREDGRAIILESKNRKPNPSGYYVFHLGRENAIRLTDEIIKYLEAWGIEYTAEDKAYCEEINVYADEVERSITVSGDKVSFICYTDDENDDYWTFLTPHKAKYFVELMLGYINSTEPTAYKA